MARKKKGSVPAPSPSARLQSLGEKKAASEQARRAREKQDQEVRAAVAEVLRTDAGRVLWAELVRRCGFFSTSLVFISGGDVAKISTEGREAQRYLYLKLRELAPSELLRRAEALADPQTEEEESENA